MLSLEFISLVYTKCAIYIKYCLYINNLSIMLFLLYLCLLLFLFTKDQTILGEINDFCTPCTDDVFHVL